MPSTPKYKKYCDAIIYFSELRDVPLIVYVPTTLKGFSVKMKINIPNCIKKRKNNIDGVVESPIYRALYMKLGSMPSVILVMSSSIFMIPSSNGMIVRLRNKYL